MTQLAMFPLGSVLFPHMPLSLRVFEERYVVMLSRVLQDETSEFGVVLIERGQEVGGGLEGGEQRFTVGTVAEIVQLEAAEGFIGVAATGGRRIEVVEWLPDAPHPVARIRELPELEFTDELLPLMERVEQHVRRTLARGSEFADQRWAADVELSDEPVARAWQLAAIAPLEDLDHVQLLRATTMKELLEGILEQTIAAEAVLDMPWGDEGDDEGFDEQR